MHQVLQVYTSFSFSLIDNFLSQSIKGQALSRRYRLRVEEMSPQSCRDVASKSRRCRHNFSSISLVSSRSRRRRQDISLAENTFSRRDVAATSPRPTGDLKKVSKESQKKLNMFDFTATPSRPAKSPGDVAATSLPPTETDSPSGHQLVSRPLR